jgi:predicted Zn-dependent peptidase
MPRGEINWDIGTDLRMNAVEDHVRYVEERMDVSQGKLVMGFRLGECMEEPDRAALHVFNAVFGSGATSKLFLNVREKLSLCYYASSAIVLRKGLMLVSSGVAFENFEKARDEIFAQLEAVKKGEISDEEMTWARRAVASDLRAAMDSQGDLEGFWLSQALDGLDYGPRELAELVGEVTKEDVMAVANSLECDLIYFLRGEDEAADPASEEEDDAEA